MPNLVEVSYFNYLKKVFNNCSRLGLRVIGVDKVYKCFIILKVAYILGSIISKRYRY